MAVTRANVEVMAIARVGPLMTLAGMDGTTVNGTNADLNDPIGWAVRQLGYATDSPVAVDDTDVARVPIAEYDGLFDLTEYRTLMSVLGNYDDVDLTVGPRSQKYSQTVAQIEGRLKRLKARLDEAGWLGPVLETGVITQDFVTKGDDTIIAFTG